MQNRQGAAVKSFILLLLLLLVSTKMLFYKNDGVTGVIKKWQKTVLCLALVASLSGCATQNQSTGTAVGAVLGAAIGHAIGGKNGALLGAGLGAAMGNSIGKQLDEKDRQQLAQARQRALDQQTPQNFYAASARANVVVTPGPVFYEPSRTQIALASDLQSLDVVQSDGESSIALLDFPVYRNPDFSSAPKLTLPRGANVTQVATLKSDPKWVLVGEKDFAIGYVPAIYFNREIAAKLATATNLERNNPSVADAVPRPVNRQAVGAVPAAASRSIKTEQLLSANESYVPPAEHMRQPAVTQADFKRAVDAGNRNAQAKSSAVSFIAPAVECKELTSVLLTNDKVTSREASKACRKPGAGWAL